MRRGWRLWIIVMACAALAACALAPPVPPAAQVLQDGKFKPGTQRIDADDVFAFSPAMQEFLQKDFAALQRAKGKRQGLVEALYEKTQLKLEYDSAITRNAAEAFDARSGNCLSLVIMTAAFAKHLDLPVRYSSVFVDDYWSRSGDLYFLSGHVNVSLGMRIDHLRTLGVESDLLTIDFMPPEQLRGQRASSIDEATVVAMYMNNRAAENLHDGQLDEAYWWAREAVLQAPRFMAGYNTLAVIYRRHGDAAAAERTLRLILDREPGNLQAMSNMVVVLNDQGRLPEAETLQATLRELQPYPPYRYFDLGMQAMKSGDYRAARDWFSKEVARSAYSHEFHFWLALANYGLGDMGPARKHMALALENSTTRKEHDIYAAKLDWLNAHRSPLLR
jgi:Flp pilus assembly protein TadD